MEFTLQIPQSAVEHYRVDSSGVNSGPYQLILDRTCQVVSQRNSLGSWANQVFRSMHVMVNICMEAHTFPEFSLLETS